MADRLGLRVAACVVIVLVAAGCRGSAPRAHSPSESTIRIASFNLQAFGPSKAGRPDLLAVMARIIGQYDVVAVQEIRDASGTAALALLGALHAAGLPFDVVIGPREGRTTSKEQYAFFYDTRTVEAVGTPWLYADAPADRFEREPFAAAFRVRAGTFDFVLVDVHTRPESAVAEIAGLVDVIRDAAARTGEDDVICLGDFNADGSYFDENTYPSVFPPAGFAWLIPNDLDTTVASSSNTYDRFVTLPSVAEDWSGKAGVDRYDRDLPMGGLVPRDVSDHYPVWAEFYTDRDTR